ncbi:hypothetical protein NXY07_00005 (plasmid) [Phocaeicola dorei]|nr:hypothetical protein [Phocaeicola dorei]
MKLVRGVPLLLERHVHVRGYVSVPLYKHKTNSMVQTIATLIDETLMVMGGPSSRADDRRRKGVS